MTTSSSPAETVVLLGASNLTLGFPLIVENLRRRFDVPLRVFAALGHGRSYGQSSRVLWRELPGILESDLWPRLEETDRSGRKLLLTDIGNDLAYGVSVPTILEWLETCLDRVGASPAETIVTLPPVESIDRLSEWRYRLMRAILFPSCRFSLATIRERAVELASRVAELGAARGLTVIRPESDWYGLDPIHPKRRLRSQVWQTIFASWPGRDSAAWAASAGRPAAKRVRRMRSARRTIRGRVRETAQPAMVVDGCEVSLF